MGLLQEVKYESEIKRLEDISPQSVLALLKDVRTNIAGLDSSLTDANLAKVLEIIESGKYEINGHVSTRVNLTTAQGVVKAYREYSEGGCQSCVNLGRETIDAQDASSGWYCRVSDSDFDKEVIGDRPRVRYSGFSPKISKHYKTPCDDWKPRFSPTIDKLIEQEQLSP